MAAQFVLKEHHELLWFVLGQKPANAPGKSCKKVLTPFNDFPTHTAYNFKEMLYQLQLLYVYNTKKSLAENRHDIQDFCSCLTSLRCAVVEGGHPCEAASCTLQGYKLCDPIQLVPKEKELKVLVTSTLFRPVFD